MGIPEPVYTVSPADLTVEVIVVWILLYTFSVIIYYLMKGILRRGYHENDELEENDEEVNE